MFGFIARIGRMVQPVLCRLYLGYANLFGTRPRLECWLMAHPRVADSLKWQPRYESNAYDIPESAKDKWRDWSSAEQKELIDAFNLTWTWLHDSADPFRNLDERIPYPPVNIADNVSVDAAQPHVVVSEEYARALYVHWVALNFVVEIAGLVPWSLTDYDDEERQVLLDSAAIMSRRGDDKYTLCNANVAHDAFVYRDDNLGQSLIAPPRYTYAFLRRKKLIGATRRSTIVNLLQWLRDNALHFYGSANYGNMEAHWQYRGIPPITKIIEGTKFTELGQFGHWTAGCHGTCGFLRNVLRAANIPVQITRICDHALPYFMTEGLYLDHGDNPYNIAFKSSVHSVEDLLIDEATFVNWFGRNTKNHDDNCGSIGRQLDILLTG